jgi:hypothetical protein
VIAVIASMISRRDLSHMRRRIAVASPHEGSELAAKSIKIGR